MEQQPPPTIVYTSTTEQPYMDNYEYTHTIHTYRDTTMYTHLLPRRQTQCREQLGLGLWVDLFNL